MKPLVSVLTTAFNRENYIAEAIESVLASSYSNFELIITDNCSTDRTFAIAKRYEAIDKRVKVYKNEENIGQFPNRNYAASLARGEYIKYLDSDDIIYPHGLATLVAAALKYPQAGLIVSYSRNENLTFPILMEPEEVYKNGFLKGQFINVGPTDTLIRKDAFSKVGGFNIPSYAGTDTELNLKLGSVFPVVLCQPGVAWYREHEGQEIRIAQHTYEYELNNFPSLMQLLNAETCPLSVDDKIKAIDRLRVSYVRSIISFAVKFKVSLVVKLFRMVRPNAKEFFLAFQKART